MHTVLCSRRGFIVGPAAVLTILMILGFAAAAQAHHGWASYHDEEFSLAGTVVSAALGNPHGLIKVRDEQGRVWDVVLGPPRNQSQAGLTEALVPTGAAITAHGHRHVDPGRLEVKTERLLVNGRTFEIYPNRS